MQYIRCIYFLFWLIIPGYACSQWNLHLINSSGRPVWIQKRSVLEDGAYPYIIESLRDKIQTITLEDEHSVILFVGIIPAKGAYGSQDGVAYLFRPNDTVLVKVNNELQPVISHISSSERNKELQMALGILSHVNITPYNSLRKSKSKLLKDLYSESISLKDRDRILDSLSRKYIQSTDAYTELHHVKKEAGELYKSHFKGMLYYSKLNAYNPRSYKYKKSIATFYSDSLKKWSASFACNDCGGVPFYKLAASEVFNIYFKSLQPAAYLMHVSRMTSGSLRDFLLSKYMLSMMDNRINSLDSCMQLYEKLCRSITYKSYVNNNYKLRTTPMDEKDMASVLTINKDRIRFGDLIASYSGKMIYLDFWASWCAPCLKEMPYSKQLQEKLKGCDVEFIYISMDTDFNSWVKASKKMDIPMASGFILANSQANPLNKMLDLQVIPRYVIFDKDGKILFMDAPRPSDKETWQLLLKHSKD